uniref:Uncharacterized protein n=2 Tax=Chrysotila carterae TaxID=13221 RepID=A0A7S4BD50_CHRCT|mmetsp:Transcript_30597/g.64363  ORF Transcript_30597/g.64363 Transcript_30597/m.64363 type:complete len:390 (+) Transcript_30597:253-1422(+)
MVRGMARPILRGVVFDMDGTLTVPNIDFGLMYKRCGVDRSSDILAEVRNMSPAQAATANEIIEKMEADAAATMELEKGAAPMLLWLRRHGIPTALVTRNSAVTVRELHRKLKVESGLPAFDPAISRDDDVPPKPHPGALERIARQWNMPLGSHILMVGDSPSNDVVFGRNGGVSTALVAGSGRSADEGGVETNGADLCVSNLLQLPPLLWRHFEVPGQLGTGSPLIHYPIPKPGSMACDAAKNGDVAALRNFALEQLDAQDESGNTPLIWAADAGQLDAVKFLLDAGVNVNTKGYIGGTAVSRASRRGHVDVLDALLASPSLACIDEPNEKMQSPLHFAAFKKHRDAVDKLLVHGASTVSLDRKGRTPAEDTSDERIRDAILEARDARR